MLQKETLSILCDFVEYRISFIIPSKRGALFVRDAKGIKRDYI